MIKIGEKFNKLTVVDNSLRDNSKNRLYLCKCDCGNYSKVRDYPLKAGTIKTCGCGRKNGNMKRSLPMGISSYRQIIRRYKANAKNSSRECSLNQEEFINFFKQNCYYCNVKPILMNPFGDKRKLKKDFIKFNGIDRIDSNLGYSVKNCVTCCSTCNRMKLDHPQNEFILHCRKIVKHINKQIKNKLLRIK